MWSPSAAMRLSCCTQGDSQLLRAAPRCGLMDAFASRRVEGADRLYRKIQFKNYGCVFFPADLRVDVWVSWSGSPGFGPALFHVVFNGRVVSPLLDPSGRVHVGARRDPERVGQLLSSFLRDGEETVYSMLHFYMSKNSNCVRSDVTDDEQQTGGDVIVLISPHVGSKHSNHFQSTSSLSDFILQAEDEPEEKSPNDDASETRRDNKTCSLCLLWDLK
ncbi:uncharacterized protein V6R79_001308 [Siganus canaliculatus]